MSLIGIIRWMVELGRVETYLEVFIVSSHMAMPMEGHLEQMSHMFEYLRSQHNTEIIFDPSDPVIDISRFQKRDWASSKFGHIKGID